MAKTNTYFSHYFVHNLCMCLIFLSKPKGGAVKRTGEDDSVKKPQKSTLKKLVT